jgi:hypothetical protein
MSRPDLRGTWKVTIASEWVDPQTNEKVPPIIAYAGVVQTQSKLQISPNDSRIGVLPTR